MQHFSKAVIECVWEKRIIAVHYNVLYFQCSHIQLKEVASSGFSFSYLTLLICEASSSANWRVRAEAITRVVNDIGVNCWTFLQRLWQSPVMSAVMPATRWRPAIFNCGTYFKVQNYCILLFMKTWSRDSINAKMADFSSVKNVQNVQICRYHCS